MWGCRRKGLRRSIDTGDTRFWLRRLVRGHTCRKSDAFPRGLALFWCLFGAPGEFSWFGEKCFHVLCAELRLSAGGADTILDGAFVECEPSTEPCKWLEQVDLEGGRKQSLVLGEDFVAQGVQGQNVALDL